MAAAPAGSALPPTKAALLAEVDKLSYAQRVRHVSQLAAAAKGTPQLTKLIADLREHPAPDTPSIEVDEGFTELLPAQKRNVAKHHTEDQLALFAASAGGLLEPLKEELVSTSLLMKQFTITQLVKNKEVSDAFLRTAYEKGGPRLRTDLLHACIRWRRVALLESLFPAILADDAGKARSILHGCSAEFVKKHLSDPEFFNIEKMGSRANISWKHIARYHGPTLVELMRVNLAATLPRDRYQAYSRWNNLIKGRSMKRLLVDAKQGLAVLELQKAYPIESAVSGSSAVDLSTLDREQKNTSFSPLISENYAFFVDKHPAEFCAYLKETMYLDGTRFHSLIPSVYPPIVFPTNHALDLARFMVRELKIVKAFPSLRPPLFAQLLKKAEGPYLRDTVDLILEYVKSINTSTEAQRQSDNNYLGTLVSETLNGLTTGSDKRQARRTPQLIRLVKELLVLLPRGDSPAQQRENWWLAVPSVEAVRTRVSHSHPAYFLALFEMLSAKVTLYMESEKWSDSAKDNECLSNIVESTLYINLKGMTEQDQLKWREPFDHAIRFFVETFGKNIFAFGEWFANVLARPYVEYRLRESPELQLFARKFLTDEILSQWSRSSAHHLYRVLNALSNKTHVYDIHQKVTSHPDASKMTESVKDQLRRYQDVTQPAVRNAFQKAANSTKADRVTAINFLCEATLRANSPVELRRTLQFLQTKLKNETLENRTSVLSTLGEDSKRLKSPSVVADPAVLEAWLGIIEDLLNSPDFEGEIDSMDIEYIHCQALEQGLLSANESLIDFGIELPWKYAQYSHGARKAAVDFVNDVETSGFFEELDKKNCATVHQGFELLYKALEKRVGTLDPAWNCRFPDYCSSIYAHTPTVVTSPLVQAQLRGLIADMEANAPKDLEGLYIVEKSDAITKWWRVLDTAITNEKDLIEDWGQANFRYASDALRNYTDAELATLEALHKELSTALLKSRMVASVAKTLYKKVKKESHEEREKFFTGLLANCPSAIYWRPVSNFLVKHRQAHLDPFLHAEKSFRGVFFIAPEERKSDKKRGPIILKQNIKAKPGKPKRPTKKAVVKMGAPAPTDEDKEMGEEARKARREVRAEEALQKDLAAGETYHDDYFTLAAVYKGGLRRLLPRQLEKLAAQHMVEMLNTKRGRAQRIKSAIRWTLMPNIGYVDVVNFHNEHGDASKENKAVPLPVYEAIIRGVMYTDEPTVPLRFLLSPKFLSSNLARVFVAVVNKCVPYLPPGGSTKLIRYVLTGKRRQQMKVTAYKEVIRMLARLPSSEHIQMMLHEWNRAEVHRDVRIAILQSALRFLSTKPDLAPVAWEMLNSAVKSPLLEIQVAMLSIQPPQGGVDLVAINTLEKTRLRAHLDALSSVVLPVEHSKRAAREIVLSIATTTTDADIRFIAFASLKKFALYGIAADALPLLQKFLTNFTNPLFVRDNSHDNNIFMAQWKRLYSDLLTLSGLQYVKIEVMPGPVQEVINTVLRALPATDDWRRKPLLAELLQYAVEQFPNHESTHLPLLAAVERTGLYYEQFLSRKIARHAYQPAEAIKLFEEAMGRAYLHPSLADSVINKFISTHLSSKDEIHFYEHLLRNPSPSSARLVFQLSDQLARKANEVKMLRSFVSAVLKQAISYEQSLPNLEDKIVDLINACHRHGYSNGTATSLAAEELLIDVFELFVSSHKNSQAPTSVLATARLTRRIVAIILERHAALLRTRVGARDRMGSVMHTMLHHYASRPFVKPTKLVQMFSRLLTAGGYEAKHLSYLLQAMLRLDLFVSDPISALRQKKSAPPAPEHCYAVLSLQVALGLLESVPTPVEVPHFVYPWVISLVVSQPHAYAQLIPKLCSVTKRYFSTVVPGQSNVGTMQTAASTLIGHLVHLTLVKEQHPVKSVANQVSQIVTKSKVPYNHISRMLALALMKELGNDWQTIHDNKESNIRYLSWPNFLLNHLAVLTKDLSDPAVLQAALAVQPVSYHKLTK